MTVALFTGTIRSGKSLEGVKTVIDNLRRGRHVYTNIDGLDDTKCVTGISGLVCEKKQDWDDYEVKKHLHYLAPTEVKEFFKYVDHPSSCIIIDEAHTHFDAREWSDVSRKEANTWIKMSGHHGHDIVFLTQDVDELDKRIKSLVEWTFRYSKVDYVGNLVKYKYQVVQYKFAQTKQEFCKFYRTYDKRIFDCYKSFSAPDIVEVGAISRPNILKHWTIYLLPFLLAFLVYLGWRSSFFSGDFLGAHKIARAQAALVPVVRKSDVVGGVSPVVHPPVFSATDKINVIEFKRPVLSAVAPVVCRVTSIVKFEDAVIEMKDCGNRIEKYINGVLDSTSVARHSASGVEVVDKNFQDGHLKLIKGGV